MSPNDASLIPLEHEMSLEELRDSGPESLASWTKGQLLGYGEGPHAIAPRGADVVDGIIGILAPGFDEERRERLSKSVGALISDWRESTDPGLEFLGGLLWLVTGLDLSPPATLLQQVDGSLKGRSCRFGDVHALALGSLSSSMREEERLIYILRRDIRDPRYTAICANMLLERTPESAAQFLPELINIGARHKEQVHLESLLRTAMATLSVETFLDSLREGMGMLIPATPSGAPLIDGEGRTELVRICQRYQDIHVCRNYNFDIPIVMILPRDHELYRDPLIVSLPDLKEFENLDASDELPSEARAFNTDWIVHRFGQAKESIDTILFRIGERMRLRPSVPAAQGQPP